jgi:hypothetical protein
MKIPFVGQAYVARSRVVDCQECVNLYPESNQATAKGVASLVDCPGLVSFSYLSESPMRGMYTTGAGRLFVVSSNAVYEMTAKGLGQLIGYIETVTGKVNFAENDDSNADGRGLVLVDGNGAYLINPQTRFL